MPGSTWLEPTQLLFYDLEYHRLVRVPDWLTTTLHVKGETIFRSWRLHRRAVQTRYAPGRRLMEYACIHKYHRILSEPCRPVQRARHYAVGYR